jgi:dihydrofolate synthase/folylpolyglutamate synthase
MAASDLERKLQQFVTMPNHAIVMGTDRVERFLADLGNPQLRLPPIIHVAGTNGKGSTIAFMRAICEAAGLRVHVFTSPHLINFNERIRLAGTLVDNATLLKTFQDIATVNKEESITFFEMITVAAFVLFAREPADVLLLEVGLGGRLDATNVITPAVSVITRISYDHTHLLGDTIEQISGEKAGIMKPGVPCVVGYQVDEKVNEVFRARSAELGCALYEYGQDFSADELPDGFIYSSPPLAGERSALPDGSSGRMPGEGVIKFPLPALLGAHQILNAATAITAVKLFSENITDENIREGLQTAEWPGRLQHITTGTIPTLLPRDFELWYDGAHNDSGAEALAEQCRRWSGQGYEIHIFLGMLKTKTPAVFENLIRQAKTISTVPVPGDTPSYSAAELAEQISAFAPSPVYAAASIEKAIHHIIPAIQPSHPQLVLVCGSLHLAEILA